MLSGRIFDDRGYPMSPAHAQKGGRRYRYYVSQALLQQRKTEAGSVPRVPAPEIEAAVLKLLSETEGQRPDMPLAEGENEPLSFEIIERRLERVIVHQTSLEILLRSEDGPPAAIMISWVQPNRAPARQILSNDNEQKAEPAPRRMRAQDRARILVAIAKARLWVEQLVSGEVLDTHAIAQREGCSERAVRMTLELAFIAPELIEAIEKGQIRRGVGLTSLAECPAEWSAQMHELV